MSTTPRARARNNSVEVQQPKPPLGSIEGRPKIDPLSYRAVWRVNGEKQAMPFDTYTEAYNFLVRQAENKHNGLGVLNVHKTRTPFATYAWRWYHSRYPEGSAQSPRISSAIKKFEPYHGQTALIDLTREDFQNWVNAVTDPTRECADCEAAQIDAGDDTARCAEHRRKGNGPVDGRTIRDYVGALAQIMRFAQMDGYLPKEMALPVGGRGVIQFPDMEQRMICLSEPQIDHLLAICLDLFPAHYALVHLTAHTGLRQGEVLGLTRDCYSRFGNPRLLVKQSAHKGTRRLKSTKTKRQRRVRLFPCCAEVLDAHLAGHEHDLIFPDQGGRIMSADNWRNRVWNRLVEAAGYRDMGLHFHDLRHSHCTWLLEDQGWSYKAVAKRLGHSSASMTLDVYGHFRDDDHEDDLVDKIVKRQAKADRKAAKQRLTAV